MFYSLLLIFPIYFTKCSGLTETKHMSGGVFSWPDALKAQRNLWYGINFKILKFYKSEPNIADIVDRNYLSDLDFNISKKVEDLMDKIRDKFDKSSDSSQNEEQEEDKRMNFKFSYILQAIQKNFGISKQIYLKDSDSNCGTEYPNAHIIGKIFSDEDCAYNDRIIGEFLSYILIIIPLLIIGILAFIFYIVFCFGCCCCCKAKKRDCPNIVSIVFFALIAGCMLIAVCFHIAGAVYLLNIINFATSDKLYDEVEEIMNLVEPTINKAISDISNDVSSSVQVMSNGISEVINDILPSLEGGVKSVTDNLSIFEIFFKNLSDMTDHRKQNVSKYENEFNKIISENEICQITYSQKDEFMDFSQLPVIIKDLKNQIDGMDIAKDLSDFTGPLGDSINETFGDITDLFNFSNISLNDMGDFGELRNIREKFDIDEYIKPWMLIVAKILLFFVSFLCF